MEVRGTYYVLVSLPLGKELLVPSVLQCGWSLEPDWRKENSCPCQESNHEFFVVWYIAHSCLINSSVSPCQGKHKTYIVCNEINIIPQVDVLVK